ncbi:hypothetical protein VTN49DRAFT_6542 [Thermomyces lanuginosus]|uniref:uncharacterized protein n=1 Tax=Thermomyces lanuginosus TaxID=5541 RepID=UPI003742AD23
MALIPASHSNGPRLTGSDQTTHTHTLSFTDVSITYCTAMLPIHDPDQLLAHVQCQGDYRPETNSPIGCTHTSPNQDKTGVSTRWTLCTCSQPMTAPIFSK